MLRQTAAVATASISRTFSTLQRTFSDQQPGALLLDLIALPPALRKITPNQLRQSTFTPLATGTYIDSHICSIFSPIFHTYDVDTAQ